MADDPEKLWNALERIQEQLANVGERLARLETAGTLRVEVTGMMRESIAHIERKVDELSSASAATQRELHIRAGGIGAGAGALAVVIVETLKQLGGRGG